MSILMITANGEIQSIEIDQNNNNGEHDSNGRLSSNSTVFNPRFFRTKCKQRSNKNLTDINGGAQKEISTLNSEPRSLSPPSVLLFTDETNEDDHSALENNLSQETSSVPIFYSNYQRVKSQSAKLPCRDRINLSPKKVVHFADDYGLDLSQIKIVNTDELPFVPNEAFKDLHINDNEHNSSNSKRSKTIMYMEPQFDNPIYNERFNDRISRQKILLEQTNVIDNKIYGTIRLVSLGLHKRVKVRLTTDNWLTFTDYDATYIDNSYDGIYDRFSFTIEINRYRICNGNTIEFCICYESFGGPVYWDNNYQQNYRFYCVSRTIPDYTD